MNRAEAMLAALERAGFRGSVDHDLVRLEPPAGLACVALGADADGYLVSVTLSGPAFEHRATDTQAHRRARKALYAWSMELRNACALAWPGIERYPMPDPGPIAPVVPPPYEHDYPLWSPVDDALVHAYQGATREHRIVVVQEWRAWGSGDGGEYDAPRVTWHEWARDVAADLGAAVGWAGIEGQTIDAMHPAAAHVSRILGEATRRAETPAGIVAFDMRGLTLGTVETFVRALVEDGQARHARGEPARGAIILCDRPTAVYLWRSVPLTFDPPADSAPRHSCHSDSGACGQLSLI
jgi:hypothetical protein